MTKVRESEPSGAWMGNLINWLIGTIMIQIWMMVGMLMGIFGDWQTPLDAIMEIPAAYGPAGISDVYTGDLTYEV